MTSSSDSSTDSKKSYNSNDVVPTDEFTLSDEMKIYCLEGLHCSEAKDKALPSPKVYSTRTSRWARNKACSVCAYTLLKVKRWYLVDENFLFDPLKKCTEQVTLDKPLWRELPGDSKTQCHDESKYSVDAILNVFQFQTEKLRILDSMLEPLDKALRCETEQGITALFCELKERSSSAPTCRKDYMEFIYWLGCVLRRSVLLPKGSKMSGAAYEATFQRFIACLDAFIPRGEEGVQMCCAKSVDISLVEKIIFPVELESQKRKPVTLEVSSRPDLFIYERPNNLHAPKTVVAVVEAKGQKNGKPVHSDDECDECEDTVSSDDIEEKFTNLSLSTVEEENDDDYDDDGDFAEIQETALELLVNDTRDYTRDWLRNTRSLPPLAQLALKRFLPQLVGEMICASRSKNMKYLVCKSGLIFGIGLVGFDVYFVTILNSCRYSSESVINSGSAFTNVFVTRPFNFLLKEDRRIIMKTLTASFYLKLY